MTVSELLCKHIFETAYEDIPESAVEVAKKSILDALGVMFAASTLGEGCKEIVKIVLAGGGKEESTILGFNCKVPAVMAAFANGAMAHAIDFEDVHDGGLVHSNAATIPAALAIAESLENISGKEFLASIILGSDLSCRLGLAMNEDLGTYGWFNPQILGVFGATAAASKLLRLDVEQMVDAFSLTLCQASCSDELAQSPKSIVRSIRDAFSAKAGVLSALMAREGIKGFTLPFEGKGGLFNLYAEGNYNPDTLTNNLGKVYENANVSFKPWPGCRGTHAYINAVLDIINEYDIEPDDIVEIKAYISQVNTMLCEPLEMKQNPKNIIGAKFSIPFVVATALLNKRVSLEHYTAEAIADKNVLEMAKKVTYEVDKTLTLKETNSGSLTIKTKDGSYSKKIPFPYGHPKNPVTKDDIINKFLDCAKYSAKRIPESNLKHIIEMVFNLEEVERINEITALFAKP
ncbi:MAG: MmgE/PrpD family protein [Dethiobacteria bacterium]